MGMNYVRLPAAAFQLSQAAFIAKALRFSWEFGINLILGMEQ